MCMNTCEIYTRLLKYIHSTGTLILVPMTKTLSNGKSQNVRYSQMKEKSDVWTTNTTTLPTVSDPISFNKRINLRECTNRVKFSLSANVDFNILDLKVNYIFY